MKKNANNTVEKIKKIVKIDNDNLGYKIHTNKQIITCFIDNNSDCCENWGFITTEDKLEQYVGSELLSIKLIDMDYKSHPLLINHNFPDILDENDDNLDDNLDENDDNWHGNETSFCFIDVNTSVGVLQFAIYNTHNGYYGHKVKIKSNQLNHETML
jgi:hypothetical protein